MQKLRLLIACAVVIVGAMLPLTAGAVPPSAAQATATFEYTKNMHPLGYSPRVVPLDNTVPGAGVNTRIRLARHGPRAGVLGAATVAAQEYEHERRGSLRRVGGA